MSSASRNESSPAGKRRTKAAARVVSWRQIPESPVILIQGPEEYLALRAMDAFRQAQRERYPDLELSRVDAAAYTAGELSGLSSPSLFGEAKLIEVSGLASMNDIFLEEALAYLDAPAPECALVLHHGGGVRGKKLLEAIKSSGAPVVECQPLKKEAEKIEFIKAEFAAAARRIEPEAVRELVTAMGAQISELATACQQLIADVPGVVSRESVDRYYGGRVEVTAFKVADAAVAGQASTALSLLRHALATGVDPVPMVAALAMKVRSVAKVHGARGSAVALAKELGLAPWQVDQARREAERWSEAGLTRALRALAEADAQVKGAGRDPVYAVERAVTVIALASRN